MVTITSIYLIEGIRGAATISAKYSADTKKGNDYLWVNPAFGLARMILVAR
jgi:hypothetical protein